MHSSSGFYSDARRTADQRSRPPRSSQLSGTRRNPYDFTGCLVHAELIERNSDGQVSRIIGFFNHNPGCSSAVMTRIPSIPLHPHVYEIALQQPHSGARYVSRNSRHVIFTYHKYDPQCCRHPIKKFGDDKEQCIPWHGSKDFS